MEEEEMEKNAPPPIENEQYLQALFLSILDQTKVMRDAAVLVSQSGVDRKYVDLGAKLAGDIYSAALVKQIPYQTAYKAAMEIARELGIILNSNKKMSKETLATLLGKSVYNNLSGIPTRTRQILQLIAEDEVRTSDELVGGIETKTLKSMALAALLAGTVVPQVAGFTVPGAINEPDFEGTLQEGLQSMTGEFNTATAAAIDKLLTKYPNPNVYKAMDIHDDLLPSNPERWNWVSTAPHKLTRPGIFTANVVEGLIRDLGPFVEDGNIDQDGNMYINSTQPEVLDKKGREKLFGMTVAKDLAAIRNAQLGLPYDTAFASMEPREQLKKVFETEQSEQTKKAQRVQQMANEERAINEEKERLDREIKHEQNMRELKNKKVELFAEKAKSARREVPEHGFIYNFLSSEGLATTIAIAGVVYVMLKKSGIVKKAWDDWWSLGELGKRNKIEEDLIAKHTKDLIEYGEKLRKQEIMEGYEAPLEGDAWTEYLEKEIERQLEATNLPYRQRKRTAEKWFHVIEGTIGTLLAIPTAFYAWNRTETYLLLNEYNDIIAEKNKWWDSVMGFVKVGAGVAGTVISAINPAVGKAVSSISDKAITAATKAVHQEKQNVTSYKQPTLMDAAMKATKQFDKEVGSQIRTQIETEPMKLPAAPAKPVAIPSKVPVQVKESVTQVQPLSTRGRKSLQTKVAPSTSTNRYLNLNNRRRAQQSRGMLLKLINLSRKKKQTKRKKTRR